MTKLRGFTAPYTATGRSSLVPEFPWYYSADLLMVVYRADPAAVIELVPEPLEPGLDPGLVGVVWADFQSCYAGKEELLDPVRSQYKECWIVVAAAHNGRPVARQVYAWVDKDFSLMRGVVQGFAKKMGSIYMTRPVRAGKAGPRLEPGAEFGATVAASDRRLIEARVTLAGTSDPPLTDPSFVPFLPVHQIRHLPSVVNSHPASVQELVLMRYEDVEIGEFWTGAAELEFFESPVEELLRIAPMEVLGGYWTSRGLVMTGGEVIDTSLTIGSPLAVEV